MNKISHYFRQHDRAWVLSLFMAVCLVYLPFLGNEFFFDDRPFFFGDVSARYAHSFFHFDLRWFAYVTLGWTAALFSDVVPHFFHLGNLLLHAANAIVLFYLLRLIIGAVISDAQESPALIRGAWFAALIFAVHPVAVYAVGYVVQRSILMATLLVLLMLMAYVRGLLTGQIRWFVMAVLCYFIAVFSKEHSVLAPALLVALTFLLREKNTASKLALWMTWGALSGVAVLITLRAHGVLGSPYETMAAELFEQQGVVAGTPMLHMLSALTQAGLFFKYLLLWLLPSVSWMSIDMRESFTSTWNDWYRWLGLMAYLSYGVVALKLLLRSGIRGLIGFALLCPWLQFAVELTGIRVQEPFVLYRSYLWMPGLLLLVPLLAMKFPQRRTTLLLGCVALLLLPLAWNRLWVFADNYRLWNDAAVLLKHEREAGADRIFYNRGQALMAAQRWDEAARDFERSVAISPQLAPIHINLGMAYIKSNRFNEALGQFEAAIAIKSEDHQAHFGKGIALMRLKRVEEARKELKLSCQMNNLAACLITSGTVNLQSTGNAN